MRVSVLALPLLLLLPRVAVCQSSQEDNLQGVVRELLDQKPGLVLLEGPMEGPLNRGGDAVGVAITKVVAGRDIGPDEMSRILLLINCSFTAPRIIENESDRQPRTTLFILRYLSSLPAPPELKEKIVETQQLVRQAAKSTPHTAPGP